jgi:hypothetical protein
MSCRANSALRTLLPKKTGHGNYLAVQSASRGLRIGRSTGEHRPFPVNLIGISSYSELM